jgi:adenylate cyclase
VSPRLDGIRRCFEGVIPSSIATCAPDGTPNVCHISQVEYVDPDHVALTFQFFNKTRENILNDPRATVRVVDPQTAEVYLLDIEYLRTETQGPLFERMKAKLAGIASHTGMSGVFHLRGADLYAVRGIRKVHGEPLPEPLRRPLFGALRECARRLAAGDSLERLFDDMLEALEQQFAIRHSMILLLDGSGQRLYTVASRGYSRSGVGSEIALGAGVIGVCARERAPIRIGFMSPEYAYGRAVRESAEASGLGALLESEIPFPGLPDAHSQMAVPLVAQDQLLGVLFVESSQDLSFWHEEEDALATLASQLGVAMKALQQEAETEDEHTAPSGPPPPRSDALLVVRHYAENDSVFLGDEYLIKGVAGAILWALLRDYAEQGRMLFSNRELRVDPRCKLPDIGDNLEARLVLLQRRLQERDQGVRLEKAGRGRLRLCVLRPLRLVEGPGSATALQK